MSPPQNRSRVLDRLADYSDESLLKELRRIASAIGRPFLTLEDVEKHARCRYTLLKQRFGGLTPALKAAGLNAKEFHCNVTGQSYRSLPDNFPKRPAHVAKPSGDHAPLGGLVRRQEFDQRGEWWKAGAR